MQNIKNLTDEKLVIKIRTEDKELYAEIVDRYQTKLLRYVNYLIRDGAKAEDIVQNTFIKAYINLNGFNTSKKFSSWIYRISHNESMNIVKKNKKEIPMDENFDIAGETDLEEEFDKKELGKMIDNCMDSMSYNYSEVLILYFLEEKSYEEISDILRIPMGTVATRINRGKVLMKKICKKRN